MPMLDYEDLKNLKIPAEQEKKKTEHPEASSDLHAIIDELEYRIDKLEKKVSEEK